MSDGNHAVEVANAPLSCKDNVIQHHSVSIMEEFETLVKEGTYRQILDASLTWDDKKRSAASKWAKAHWNSVEEQRLELHRYNDRHLPRNQRYQRFKRLALLNILAAQKAKEALAIPLEPLVLQSIVLEEHITEQDVDFQVVLLEAITRRDQQWIGEYVAASLQKKAAEEILIDVTLALIRSYNLPWPDSRPFYQKWLERLKGLSHWRDLSIHDRVAIEPSSPEPISQLTVRLDGSGKSAIEVEPLPVSSILDAWSAAKDLDRLIKGLFAYKDLTYEFRFQLTIPFSVQLMTALLSNGKLDRANFIRAALGALVRGDSVGAMRHQIELLMQAKPAANELVPHTLTLHDLLASSFGGTASAAQTLLRQLDANQPLENGLFPRGCEIVFARKEKGLRSEQLAWAAERLKAKNADVGETLTGATYALQCEDLTLHKKALQILEKFAGKLDDSMRTACLAQIELARSGLTPDFYRQCLAALGQSESQDNPDASVGTPEMHEFSRVSIPKRLIMGEPNLATIAELAAERSAINQVKLIRILLNLANQDRTMYEKSLSLIDRHDSDFAEALKGGAESPELKRKYLLVTQGQGWRSSQGNKDAQETRVINTLIAHFGGIEVSSQGRVMLDAIEEFQIMEIANALRTGLPYPFISFPDWESGSLEITTLIERLQKLANDGIAAGNMDLFVALLRSTQPNEQQLAALGSIDSPQARIAAHFFAAGGMDQMRTQWHVIPAEDAPPSEITPPPDLRWNWWNWEYCSYDAHRSFHVAKSLPAEVFVSLQGLTTLPEIEDIPVRWASGFTPQDAPFYIAGLSDSLALSLPNNSEVLFALTLWGFRIACHDDVPKEGKDAAAVLLNYLAAGGPAGSATHLAVLFCLSGNLDVTRLAGSDGLLELIAQGRYNSDLACELIAACIACGSVKPARLAKSLGEAMNSGANRILWPLLRSAVSASLVKEAPPPGTPELLALASRFASTYGLREAIPGLAESAAKKGSSKLLLEARRLHEILESK